MSHPLYNPYASGNQSSTQGQYGLSNTQAEGDPRSASSFLGPGYSFSSSGASSAIPANSGQMFSSLLSQSINYRPEPSRAVMVEDTGSSKDMHTSRASEESDRLFTRTGDVFSSSGTGMCSHLMSSTSASVGHRHEVDIESGNKTLDWSVNYKRSSVDGSILNSSSALSSYASSGECGLHNPSERDHDSQAIPGLGDYDYRVSDKPAASTESSQPTYTSESAASILQSFGLEKEDLEHLISYPEDQITPSSLPYILRQIRLEKEKKATAVKSKPDAEPQPTRTVSGVDSCSLNTSARMLQDKTTSSVLQPTRVIDYGHISKYTAGVGDEIGRTSNRDNSGGSGNLLVTDTAANRHSREPLQNNSTELKSSALGSSLDQASSFTSLSSSYSSVLSSAASSSSEQTKRWQTQPNQTFQNILSSFPLQKKDTDINVLKCEATKPVPLNQLGDRQSTFKTQTPSTLSHSVHPSRPALVLIGSNDASGTKDQSKTEGQRSVAVEHIQKTQGQQKEQMQQQSMLQRHVQQTQPTQQLEQQQIKQPQKYPVLQTGQAVCLPVFGNPVPPTGFIPSLITVPTSKAQPSSKEAVSKILPAPEMMHDYDAASPRIFPHTGSLVNKECTDMKDWLSHQNSSLHLKSRTLLGQQAVGKDAKPSTSTSAQKIRHGSSSRSKSPSPYRQHGPEGERDKRRSRSRSPQSSRYNHRSRSRSCSPRYDCPTSSSYRSHSRSPKRWSSPRRKDERQSSPRKGRNRRSPLTRSNVSWSPPRRVDNKRSPPRRVNERRSPLRRGDERRPPPRRVDNRSSPPRRVNKRLSPPRTRENKRTPKKRDKSRSPPRRSHERQSSREGSSPQLNMSNSAASLAKKLLETTAVQSLSNQSDLETVVKTLAPALLAELAKMSSSLPPSSSRGKKLSSTTSSSSSTAGMKGCTIIPFKSKLGLQKSERGKVSPPTMVKLQGISKDLSHDDVFAAMEHFGKTKSVIVFRAQMEANICFENEEDAKKVKSLKSLDIKGTTITVVKKKDVTQKEMKLPLKKPATSSVSQHHTANSKMASTMTREGKVLLPTPTVPPLTGTLPCGARKSTAGKLINQSSAKVSVKGVRSVNKAKVLVSKAKYVSTKQIAKTMKTTKLPAKGEVKKAATNQKTSPENQPEAGDSRQKPIPEKSETSGPVVELKEAAEADKSENRTDREPEKGLLIQEKVLASKAEMVSSIKTPKTQVDNLAESGAVTTENVEETSAKFASVPSRSAASGNQPDVEMSTHEESETKVQESLVLPEDTAAVVEKANVTAFEPKDRADDAEPMELGATGVKVAELMEVGSYVEGKEKELRSTDQSRESRPSSSSVDTQSTETSAKALAKVKQSALSEPESTAQGPETQMEASEVQQAAGSTTDAAVEPLMPDPSTAEMTQIDSAKDASKAVCKASAASTEVPSSVNTKPTAEASKRPSSAVRPTIGEMLETNLSPINIYCWPSNHLSKGLPPGYRHLLISGLPFYFDGNYTEDDVANLLIPFGLRNKEDQLFVIPQSRMAFAMMSNGELVLYLLRAAAQHGIYLKGDRLFIEVLHIRFPLTPLQFYKFLKRALRCTEFDEGERTILIKNISQSEAWKLREALQDFGSVKNFMPLLNKLFVEFESIEDTDRFGDWYSLLCQAPAHKVIRLKKPNINCQSLRKSQRPVTAVPTDEASAKDASKAAENISAVVEEKVLTSQEKMNTTMQKPEKLPAAEAVTKESVAKDATVPSKIEASENQPGVSESKLKPGPEKSETSLQGPGVGLKETAQIDTSENRTISELAKGPSVEATILASKEEMVSTIQKAKTSEKLSATEAVSNQVIAKDATVLSQTEASENQLDVNDSKLKPIPDKSETSVKEPVEALKQTAEVDRTITKLAKGPLVEAKVLASKEQTVSMMQKPKAPSENLAATEAVSYKVIAKDVTVLSKTEACENLLEVSDSKLKPVPEKSETSLQGPGVGLKVNKSENRTISELAKGPSVEATILASNEEMVSTIQKAKTTSENVAATKAVSNQAIAKDATVLSQTEASENQLDVNDSKLKPIPDKSQTSVKEPVEGLKRTAQADKSEDRTITKLAKGPLVEAKVLASKEQTVSTMQKPKTLSDNLSATEAVSNKVIAKDVSVPLKTEACENPPEVSDSKLKAVPEISEISLQGPGVGLKETAEVDKSAKTANTAPRQDPKVLASKAERVSAMQEPQIPAEKLAAKEAVPNEMIAEDMIMPSKFEASENQPDTGDSKEKPVPDKSENRIKGPGVGSLESLEKPKTQVDKLAESGAVIKNNIEGTAPKDEGVPSRFSDSENQPQGENSKLKQSETKDQGSLEVPKDTAEAVEKANVTVFEPKDQAKLDRADEAEPMELGVTGIKGVELMEVESCTEDKGKEKTNTEGIPENSADKPRESQPPMTSVETQVTETSVKAFVQQSALSEPDSTAQGPETQIEASEVQQQAAGSTTEAAVEPLMPGGGAATKTTHKDPSTAEMTQIDSTSAKDASKAVSKASAVSTEVPSSVNTKPTAAAGSERQPAASKHSSSADYCPTVGEMLEKHLFPDRICCHPPNDLTCLDHRNRQLLISGLPIYNNGNYTDDDVANLLVPFGFENKEDQLYVIPQLRMAFAMMPSVDKMLEVMRESVQNGIYFREKRLVIQVVRIRDSLRPVLFYRFLKRQMKCYMKDEVERTVFIKNISQSEARELREALKEFGSVTNFMPLLNKLFVEFESVEDADRFGGWYSHLKQAPGHEVVRLKISAPPPTAAVSKHQPVASKPPSTADPHLTYGEKMERYLDTKRIGSFKCRPGTSPKLLISWLPVFGDGCYTEDDIIKLLIPFGYQHKDQNIYVVPQARVAFVQMPTEESVLDIIRASKINPIILKGSGLCFSALDYNISLRPFWFYESLMRQVGYHWKYRDSVIFIRNISPSETRELRQVVKKVHSVRNFLPLLNKVFVEFHTNRDADRLGVWYSLLKQPPGHIIQRLEIPYSTLPPSPRIPENALPDSKDVIEGATMPSERVAVPHGSTSPFWISLRKNPFVFPTISPWFIIPEYQTVKGMDDIEKASNRGSMCPTIMLTGLPEGNYKQEEVAKLVWPYFPKKNLHSLYYNVTVLPLQRRAFVFFADWITCCNFVKDHIKKRVSLRGDMISVHFVLQHMYPESTEEMMYKSLMKWSNAGVPDPNSLEERLLIVEISEASVDVIAFVIEVVTSITMFVSVLPLANRICIEMTDSNSVMQVVEKCNDLSSNSFTEDPAWRKVQKVEPLKSLKQRLQDSAEVTINLDLDTSSVENESPEIDKNVLKAIKVTVGQQRLVQESRAQSEEKEGQDNFTDDNVTSEAYLFDDQNFNEDCFITVDEVGDDVEVTSPDYYRSSSSKHSSRERRERQSSHVFSARNRTSTRSSKDYKSSASSSRSTKDSRSSYSSSELKKSSKHTNSPPKPSSSSCAGKASSSPPVSTDSPSSLGHKRQQSRTKSPAKSLDASAGRNRSSSPVHEREKNTAETVAASVKTCPEQLGDEARDTNSAVAKSDHDVSAEGPAAKSDESETKIETEKMHPPQQGCGSESSQAQSLDSDSNVKTLKDREKSTEEGKEDDKHVEVEIDCGSCLNSSNDQTDEQMENGGQKGSCETQITGPVGGQVLDSVEEEDKACHEEPSDMFMEDSLQVLDSVTKDQAATGPESSCVVQVDSSPGKQRSEEDALPIFKQSEDTPLIKDGVGNEQQTNNEDNSEVDTSSKQAPRSKGDEKKTKQNRKVVKDKMLSAESCEASKDAENLKSQDVNEEGDIKNHDSDGTEQEAFEILDSIDDQTETEDVSQKPETSSAQISKEDNRPIEEEEDAYQVIDSLEDQPTTTETESETDKGRIRTKKGEATASKCDRPSRRSGPKSKVSVSEEKEKSPKKQDRTVKKYETRTKVDIIADKEVTEEIMFEIVDSVGEEPVEDAATREWSGRRRSTRGKKEDRVNINLTEASEKPEEVTFKIIDSVENETANDEPTVTRRSTRGRRGNTMKDALSEKTVKEDTPTRRRQTPARESQSREKTPKKEEKAPPKESTPTRKSANAVEVSEEDATYEILDSVEDEVVEDVPPATTGKRKRGRPKKHVKTTIKGSTTSKRVDKDGSEKVADEEETTYQIVDSVEDDKVDDQPPSDEAGGSRAENISESIDKPQKRTSLAGTTKKEEEEEEEPLFHIIDSLEDDPVQEEQTATDKSNRKIKEKRKTKDESPWKEIEKGDKQKCGTTVSEAFEKLVEEGLHQKVDDDEEVNDPPSIIEGCSTGEKERTPPTDIVKEETSPIISTSDTVILERENKQKSPEKKHGASTLVNLDEVSDEEEDYPDDTADKEELRKRQSAAKEKQFANKRETRRTREREERERRSRTSSSRGEGDGGGTRRGKKRVREDEKVELVTLDTVGADEAERQQWEEEVTEGEVQELVTLDEFVEEEPDGKAEQSKLETPPLSQEDESVDDLNQESLVTLDEVGYDDEDKPDTGQAKKTLRSGKRKHDDDTEASMNFVILDEVKDEETREASKPRTRGRPRKKVRQTPVRKSTRGKNVSSQEEKEKESTVEVPPTPREASLLDKSQSKPEIPEIAEVEAASPVDIDAALAGQEQQPENKTGRSRADIKVVSKRRKESVGPEAKRSRSQSPSVPADVKLPASQPDNSLNFMVPGFFCSLCSIFNPDETARELHCSSQKHINNLQKHYQKLQQKSSSSTQS